MIKIIKYSYRSGHNKLISFLDQRRNSNNSDIDLVNKIINDVKKISLKHSKNMRIDILKIKR